MKIFFAFYRSIRSKAKIFCLSEVLEPDLSMTRYVVSGYKNSIIFTTKMMFYLAVSATQTTPPT